jgi:ribonuclease HII
VSKPLFAFDSGWREKGFFLLAGVDEAGRGPWAGPVVAAAVVLKPETDWTGLNDSKKMSPAARDRFYDVIRSEALFHAVAFASAETIDAQNILKASLGAMAEAVGKLGAAPSLILVDGNQSIPQLPARLQKTVVGGDGLSASIAAASVLAKVTRDRWMADAHRQYPAYGFDRHKGYGTPDHAEALRRHGPCALHRKSFAPVRATLSPQFPLPPTCSPN